MGLPPRRRCLVSLYEHSCTLQSQHVHTLLVHGVLHFLHVVVHLQCVDRQAEHEELALLDDLGPDVPQEDSQLSKQCALSSFFLNLFSFLTVRALLSGVGRTGRDSGGGGGGSTLGGGALQDVKRGLMYSLLSFSSGFPTLWVAL